MNYIIVEDEPLAVGRLKELLDRFPELNFIGAAANGKQGKELIEAYRPDVIFLDIEMPVLNGFEMLRELTYKPKVVFTTAYENYALQAFEENSVDYLLKPIEEKRLEKTMEKLREIDKPNYDWNVIEEQVLKQKSEQKWTSITVTSGGSMKILALSDVAYFESEDKYVMAHELGGKKYLMDRSLKTLDDHLPNAFMRVHRSFIINFDAIDDIRKNFRSLFVFKLKNKDRTEITCSNSYTKQIKDRLNI